MQLTLSRHLGHFGSSVGEAPNQLCITSLKLRHTTLLTVQVVNCIRPALTKLPHPHTAASVFNLKSEAGQFGRFF